MDRKPDAHSELSHAFICRFLVGLSALTIAPTGLLRPHSGRSDASDAVAVRSMSLAIEVRDGNTEESERAEGDDLGLRVFSRPASGRDVNQ